VPLLRAFTPTSVADFYRLEKDEVPRSLKLRVLRKLKIYGRTCEICFCFNISSIWMQRGTDDNDVDSYNNNKYNFSRFYSDVDFQYLGDIKYRLTQIFLTAFKFSTSLHAYVKCAEKCTTHQQPKFPHG
jgi:hypothetical protein